ALAVQTLWAPAQSWALVTVMTPSFGFEPSFFPSTPHGLRNSMETQFPLPSLFTLTTSYPWSPIRAPVSPLSESNVPMLTGLPAARLASMRLSMSVAELNESSWLYLTAFEQPRALYASTGVPPSSDT